MQRDNHGKNVERCLQLLDIHETTWTVQHFCATCNLSYQEFMQIYEYFCKKRQQDMCNRNALIKNVARTYGVTFKDLADELDYPGAHTIYSAMQRRIDKATFDCWKAGILRVAARRQESEPIEAIRANIENTLRHEGISMAELARTMPQYKYNTVFYGLTKSKLTPEFRNEVAEAIEQILRRRNHIS